MKMNRTYHTFLISLSLASAATAQTINWVSTASTISAGNKHFLSDGTAMPAGFHFELGYFDSGYVAGDATTWSPNWHMLGATQFNNPVTFLGYNFQADSTVVAGQSAFVSKQGYIWGYNDLSLMGLPGGEAVLLTNPTWSFPDPTNPVAFNWSVSLTSNVVFGSIDQNVSAAGGVITGAGDITAQKAPDTYHLQTAGWAVPVPEPASAGLLAVLGLALGRRKRSISLS